jgi:hypothetical protein
LIYPHSVRPSPRARAVFLLLYGALLVWQIDRWLFTPHGVASTWAARASGVTVSSGSPAGVTQSFLMAADGLDGVWLRPVVRGRPIGDFVVDLVALNGGTRVRLERVAVSAADAARTAGLHVPFRPVRASRGRSYEIVVRHVRAGSGPAIDLEVTRHDALRDGQLFADRVEQWGDLVFETSSRRATLPYWIHEVLRPWPAWVSTWPAVSLALVAFNLVLAWACAQAAGLGPAADIGEPAPAGALSRRPRAAVTPLAMTAVVAVALTGVAMAGRPTGRYRSLDLIEALPDARLETTVPSLHGGIAIEAVVIFGRIHRAIVALPTSRIAWRVDVPRGAVLRFGAAMRPDMWNRVSDGIQMRVSVVHAAGTTTAAEFTIVPMMVEAHKRLHPGEVPLAPWAGQQVLILFESTPERWGNAVNDVPVWTEPRIEWPRDPAAGEARVVRN